MARRDDKSHRRLGLSAAAHRLVYRLVQRVMVLDVTYLMVMDTQRVAKRDTTDGSLTFRFLDRDEVQRFANEPSNEIDAGMAQRVKSGCDFCYAALRQNQLISYCWLALDSIEAAHNRGARRESGVGLSFSRNAAFVYKGFTRKEFRGCGIYPQLMRRVCGAMQGEGVDYILSTTDWTNHSALRGCDRSGKEKLGMIWRFGWRRWMKTIASQPRFEQLSVRIGDAARITCRTTLGEYAR